MSDEFVLRCQLESYMECDPNGTPTNNLIGPGFTTFPESKNPKEYNRKYVHQKTEQSDVIGYAPSVSYSCDAVIDDPCVKEIMKITDNELLGADTHRNIINVNQWDEEYVYTLTEDSSPANGKTYYTKSGSTYTEVQSPSQGSMSTYYEKVTGYAAFKRTYAVIPGGRGDGTDALIYTGTMKAVSDQVKGVFIKDTKTFVAGE